MSKMVKDYSLLVGCAGIIVALDQLSKFLVRTRLDFGQTWMPISWLARFARVVHWNNTGAAFGLFPSGSLIFTIVAIIVAVAILYYFPRVPAIQWTLRVALVLMFSGAVGNLIDRLLHGTVTDFISLGTFPVFNVADASISTGVAVLVASMWIDERRARAAAEADPSPPSEAGGDGGSQAERPLG